MSVQYIKTGTSSDIILVEADEIILKDVGSALSIAVNAMYEHDSNRIIIRKSAISEEFFILSTCIAGEILQKLVNYGIRMAIVGDFSRYTSKPLKDFMHESNKGGHFFVEDVEKAVLKLEGKE